MKQELERTETMDCASIVKRGYLYDKKMGILPVTVVSLRDNGKMAEGRRDIEWEVGG